MRYRVNRLLWSVLAMEGIDTAALAGATGATLPAIYRIRSGDTISVSRAFMEGAVGLVSADLAQIVRMMFTQIGEDRYRCEPRFWGLLAERRIKLITVGEWIGMSQQRISHLRRSPRHTVPDTAVRVICERLGIEPEGFFTLVTNPRQPSLSRTLLDALAS